MPSARESSAKPAAPPAAEIRDWDLFREQLKSISTDDLDAVYAQVYQSLKRDPLGTLQELDKLSPGTRRDVLLRNLAADYPRDRHADLVKWADKSPLPEDRDLIYLVLNVGISGLDPKQVSSLYSEASDAKTKRLLAKYSAQLSVASGANSLSQCEATLKQLSPADQQSFTIDFARAALSKDLVSGSAIIMADPDRFGSGSLHAMGTTSGSKNPAATQQAIVGFAERTGDRVALKAFVSAWFITDSIEASKWAGTLPEPLRNEAYLELANQLARKGSNEEAGKFLDGITDEAVRKRSGRPE